MRRPTFVAIVLAAALAGCGDEQKAVTVTAPQGEPAPQATLTTTNPASGPGSDCGEAGGLRLKVVLGDLECDELRKVAAGYDLDGVKVQEVRGWTCASGTADTRPIIYTCARDGDEFVGEESG